MRYIHVLAAALTAAFAFALGYGANGIDLSAAPGSSPERTIHSFAYSAKRQNFGRACSYMTDSWRAILDVCVRQQVSVVPGSRKDVDENTVTYLVDFGDGWGPSKITLTRNAGGKWRISEVV